MQNASVFSEEQVELGIFLDSPRLHHTCCIAWDQILERSHEKVVV